MTEVEFCSEAYPVFELEAEMVALSGEAAKGAVNGKVRSPFRSVSPVVVLKVPPLLDDIVTFASCTGFVSYELVTWTVMFAFASEVSWAGWAVTWTFKILGFIVIITWFCASTYPSSCAVTVTVALAPSRAVIGGAVNTMTALPFEFVTFVVHWKLPPVFDDAARIASGILLVP